MKDFLKRVQALRLAEQMEAAARKLEPAYCAECGRRYSPKKDAHRCCYCLAKEKRAAARKAQPAPAQETALEIDSGCE